METDDIVHVVPLQSKQVLARCERVLSCTLSSQRTQEEEKENRHDGDAEDDESG